MQDALRSPLHHSVSVRVSLFFTLVTAYLSIKHPHISSFFFSFCLFFAVHPLMRRIGKPYQSDREYNKAHFSFHNMHERTFMFYEQTGDSLAHHVRGAFFICL